MPLRVAVYSSAQALSIRTTQAMARGIRSCGDEPVLRPDVDHYDMDCDAAVFWGYWKPQQRIAADYTAVGKPWVFLDLGYWSRGKNDSYFKVSVNDRHPTAYFRSRPHDGSRAKALGLRVQPWRLTGRTIVVLGMSGKASWSLGLEPAAWEAQTIAEIKKHTDRPIVYRPKPSWKDAKPLPGAGYSWNEHLETALADAYATVSHHSNASCDSLLAGVPTFTWDGIAKPMGLQDLSMIERPYCPLDREFWLYDAAYCQWSLTELTDGTAWKHLKSEGLIA